jgi:hypothetical protein
MPEWNLARKISNSAMAVLISVALFWGNCFSCPQVLLSLKAHQSAHGCCHKTKKTAQGCTSQALQHFVKADPGAHAPAVAGVVAAIEHAPTVARFSESALTPLEHAPPGAFSSLRI